LTPGQFVQYLQTPTQQEEPIIQYEVDSMSDDELFCLDLLDKLGSDNVTDEELQQALESAKANENLYYKQVASLRDYYKELEADKLEQDLQAEEDAKEYEYQTFADQVLNSISNFNNLQNAPVDLSQADMENLADFMLTRDATGQTEFGKILQHPAYFT
jgi:flagellar biosynthesis chaperone FliJ